MIAPFTHNLKFDILYGPEKSEDLINILLEFSSVKSVLILTDPGIIQAGLLTRIKQSFVENRIDLNVFSDVKSDPSSESIDKAAYEINRLNPDIIIGIGGGSPLDVAKMAASIAEGKNDAEFYQLMENPFPKRKQKLVLIPTTAGTGAEVSRTAVFTNSNQRKVWSWGPELYPDIVILDPFLTKGLPAMLTAGTSLDAIVHAIEACTNSSSNPIIQSYGLRAIKIASDNFLGVINDPEDLEARGHMLIASTLAGLAIDGAGTAFAHAIGHALASICHIHHGKAVSIALNAIYEWNAEKSIEIHKEIALCMGVKADSLSDKEIAVKGAKRFNELLHQSGMDLNIQGAGLDLSKLDLLIEKINQPENRLLINKNCRYPTDNEIETFFKSILNM